MAWQPPTLAVLWGRYFPPDPEEEQKIVSTVQEAMGSKNGTPIIQLRHAVQKIASIYGIENVEAALEGLEEEANARAERELEATTAALDAEARARRTAEGAEPEPAKPGDSGGRPAFGKKPPGSGAPSPK